TVAKMVRGVNQNIDRGIKGLNEKNDIDRFLSTYEIFTKAEIFSLIGHVESQAVERIRYAYDTLECSRQKEPVERIMSLDTRLNLADDLLTYTDKITMHFSMECRVPMLDLELVQ